MKIIRMANYISNEFDLTCQSGCCNSVLYSVVYVHILCNGYRRIS